MKKGKVNPNTWLLRIPLLILHSIFQNEILMIFTCQSLLQFAAIFCKVEEGPLQVSFLLVGSCFIQVVADGIGTAPYRQKDLMVLERHREVSNSESIPAGKNMVNGWTSKRYQITMYSVGCNMPLLYMYLPCYPTYKLEMLPEILSYQSANFFGSY